MWHNSSRDIDAEQFAQLGLSNTNLGGRIPSALSRLVRLQVLSLANNNFTSVPSELAFLRNIYFMDITGNPIQELHSADCCTVHGLRTDVDCGASSCSHYGNPLTAAGCKADEQQLDIPLSNAVTASICTKECASSSCPSDTPPWNPSSACAPTRSDKTVQHTLSLKITLRLAAWLPTGFSTLL